MLQMLVDTNYQFIRIRWVMISISLAIILTGIVSLIAHGGPRYGIDFRGGYKFIVKFEQPVDLGSIRSSVEQLGLEDARVSDFGNPRDILIVLPILETETAEAELISSENVQNRLADGLRAKFSGNPILEISQEKVGPKVGAELRNQGFWAILYSMLGIILYVSYRFEFKFALAGIIALMHDVMIPIGFFSLMGKEIDLTILGALLTIVGFSINDTIVIYDRIRENMRQRRRGDSYEDVINASINQTLSRTIITNGTVLLVVALLWLVGGAVIHDFAFALLVGFIAGTYSSVFIAAPILIEWQRVAQRRRERKLAAA